MTVHLHPTAYGRAAQDLLAELIFAAKTDDPLAEVMVLVPTNLCGTLSRRALARHRSDGASGVAALTVMTVDRLAELLAAPVLVAQQRRPTTGPVLSAAWRQVLKDDPGLFETVAQHPATVTALVGAHRRLRDLSGTALDAVASSGPLPSDVVRLHRRVVAALAGRWYDATDLRAAAVEAVATAAALDTLRTAVLHLPQDLDRSAAALVRALASRTEVHVVAALTGDARADAGVRTSVRRIDRTLVLPSAGRPPVATSVFHASDADDEVRGVVRQLVELLRSTPAARIAVLYGSATPHARLLHDHLGAARLQVNGPGVRPTAERALPRAFLTLLALAQDGVDRARLFRLLSGAGVLDGEDLVPAARWERVSRAAGVVGSEDWEPRLRRYADEQRRRAEEESSSEAPRSGIVERCGRNADAADGLREFVARLQQRLREGASAHGWSDVSRWALELFDDVLGDEGGRQRLPEEDRRAADKVLDVVRSLAGLDQVEPDADLTALREVLDLELADDLPRTGTTGTGVLVAPLSAAVGLEVDTIFVIGLAEGLTPSRVREDALLPESARAAAQGELPSVRDRVDRQHRLLLAAFASAPTVLASFPRGDLRRSGERLPSRWLLPTLRHLSGDDALDATRWHDGAASVVSGSPSYAATTRTTALPATEQEWRLRTLSSGTAVEDDVHAQAQALLDARHSAEFTRYDGSLAAEASSLPDPCDETKTWSPTALEHWVGCPHAYFLQRVLGVEPVDQPEELLQITPADRGNVLHDALDRFFATLERVPEPHEAWTVEDRTRLRVIGEQVADEYAARGLTGHPTLWARERELVLGDLVQVLDQDDVVRARGGRTQVRSELVFGRKGVEAVQVPLPNGRTVRLAGSADRVDTTADGSLVVVDYKSGKPKAFKGLSEQDPDKHGSKLQLPVYGYAARMLVGPVGAAVAAEYWFIGPDGRGKRIGYPITPEVERRYAQVLASVVDGIAGGVFPANVPEDRPWSSFPACPYCDPDGLGAKERRVQWQRKKAAPELAPYLDLIEPDVEEAP